MNIRRATASAFLTCAVAALGLAGAPPVGSAVAPALPDLVPLPGTIELGQADPDTGEVAIRLDTVVANRGTAHLDLQGIPDQGSVEEATAYQCMTWTSDRMCMEREEVGDFVWHPEHQHHHFEGFGLYELRTLTRKGRPNMSAKGLAAEGNKVSFCLIDYEEDSDEETPFPGTGLTGWPLYSSCVVGSGSQGISRAWRDVYTSRLIGQQVVVDSVAPGTYALVVTVDPDSRLFETDDSNNTLALKLRLDGQGLTELCVYSPDLKSCEPR